LSGGETTAMRDLIAPTRAALDDALTLSAEILRDVELDQVPLTSVALKASRLARLLNDFESQTTMQYEVSGYPMDSSGILPPEVWELAVHAGRKYEEVDADTKAPFEYVYVESISSLEKQIQMAEASLEAARDPSGSRGSTWRPQSNLYERVAIRNSVQAASARLASRRAFIYEYATRRYYELRFSGIADDVFGRIRERVDTQIGFVLQDAPKRFAAAYDNLRSENPEDWSNAVHSCRRILQDLADAVFPATDRTRTKVVDGREITIHLREQHFINRILAFVEGSTSSGRFQEIVGSQLAFLGDRLEAVFRAAQKGSHATIVAREEADRYVVYTYLIVGDILSLCRNKGSGTQSDGK
jgi:hypothetical protein